MERKRAPSIIESTLGTTVITNVSDFMLAFPCMLHSRRRRRRLAISLAPSLSLSPMSLQRLGSAGCCVAATHSSLFLITAASVFLLF